MKLLPFTLPRISFTKQKSEAPKTANNLVDTKTRASYAVKPPPVRSISYEIGDIKAAVTMATNTDRPDRSRLLAIYDYIMQDAHLNSQVMIAVNKVISEQFGMYKGEELDKEATRFMQGAWFEQMITWLLEAEFYGFSLVEFDLDPRAKSIDSLLIWRNCVAPDLKLLLMEGTIHGTTIPYGDFMEDLSLLQFGMKNDLGILQKAAYNVLWKFYARSDWSRASEKFGMPVLHIKANTNVESELDRIEQKAANFGTDGYIVTQAGDEVEIKERAGQDIHKIYLENIKYCDDQVSKLINGQTATSDEKAWSGAATVQERVLEDISFARMRRVKYAVNNQLIPFLVAKGFTFLDGLEFDYTVIKEPKADPTPTPEPPKPDEPPAKKKLHRSLDSEFFHSALHNLYFGRHDADCDCHRHHTPAHKLTLSKKTVIDGAVDAILEKGYNKEVNQALLQMYLKDYNKAVTQVFPEGSNQGFYNKFRANVAQFASAKSFQLTSAIKSTGDKKSALDQVAKYNRYHQAEVTTITARARTARQWERFQDEKHLFPNLTWIRTRSANPRELHLSYVGITLPMNHPFWQNNQPGNLWNCKCDWKTTDAPAGAEPDKIIPPAKGLNGNPFKTGMLITEDHPYFRVDKPYKIRKGILELPDELAYVKVDTEYGSYLEHLLVLDEQETENNRNIVKILLKVGYKGIKLLPRIHPDESILRERYYGSDFCEFQKTKCPDCIADGIRIEFKTWRGGTWSLKDALKDAGKKSEIAVIEIKEGFDKETKIESITYGVMNLYPRLKKVYFIMNGGLLMTKAK